jgi:hypothetical protein
MKNSHWCLALALLLALVSSPAMANDAPVLQEVMTMRVEGGITIDPNGRVIEYHIDTPLQPELKRIIDDAVPKWSFHPVTVDDQPVGARTKMQLTLVGVPHGKGYRISIEKALFRDDSVTATPLPASEEEVEVELSLKERKPLPRFPRFTVDGLVVVYVRFSPQGRVEDAFPSQSTLFNADGAPEVLAQALQEMEDNAVAAIRQWRADVVVRGGEPEAQDLTATIPVAYVWNAGQRRRSMLGPQPRLRGGVPDNLGHWRLERRSALRSVPWLPDQRLELAGASDIDPLVPLLPAAASSLRRRETTPATL